MMTMPKSLRRALILLAALVLSALAAACEKRNAFVPPPPPVVAVGKPVKQTVTEYLEFTGNTQAVQSVNLVARVEGFLQKIDFVDGQHVKQNQPLFLIEPAPYLAKVNKAKGDLDAQKAKLVQAETELARAKKLFAEKAGPDTEVVKWQRERDQGVADLEQAKAALQIAEINYGYTRVASPFTGRISRHMVDVGNLVGSSGQATQLATVIQDDPMYAYFTISERDLLRISRDRDKEKRKDKAPPPLQMGLSDSKDFPFQGVMDYYDIGVDPQSGTILLRGIFPNADGKLIQGLFVRIRAPLESKEAVTVPESAVGVAQVGHYVLVVGEKNVIEQRPVTVGSAVNGVRVIEKGLTGAETIVVDGLQKARPGSPVTPSEAKK
jgi:RND family efflux transporter MFP subunit